MSHPPRTLDDASLNPLAQALTRANTELHRAYPGESQGRQPVHTVYGGAHLFKSDTAAKVSALALRSLDDYAPTPGELATALGLRPELADAVHARVREKLQREGVEDYRIDFEDGYGVRPDDEEDLAATAAALEVATAMKAKALPPFFGIRVKAPSEELFPRAVRTLDLFLTTLLDRTAGRLPDHFVVTIPKVATPEQVTAMVGVLSLFESKALLPAGVLKLELMVETTQAIVSRHGQCTLPLLVRAAEGRCTGAHFGTYDYTASCDVTAAYQDMRHPACDFAKHMMKVSLAGTGVFLSDGATNVMPVGPHKAAAGKTLSSAQVAENRAAVHRAWKLSYDHVRHSLAGGFYQGWDLHPAQLPARYAALHAFFLEGLDAAAARLDTFTRRAAQATLLGEVFDDAATGQGLLNFFLRGIACGALTDAEAARSGLSPDEIRTRSFLRILSGRRRGSARSP